MAEPCSRERCRGVRLLPSDEMREENVGANRERFTDNFRFPQSR